MVTIQEVVILENGT